MEIQSSTIEQLIQEVWYRVQYRVESGYLLSSEKSLVFLFVMELFKHIRNDNLVVDFETQPYENLEGESKYLDVLIYTQANFKVALEFKLPKKNKSGNSNQTQTRQKIYRDIARLKYLIDSSFVKDAYFLMATDETPYINVGKKENSSGFRTYHNEIIVPGNSLVIDNLVLSNVNCAFIWEGIKTDSKNKHSIINKFAWLTPIRIG